MLPKYNPEKLRLEQPLLHAVFVSVSSLVVCCRSACLCVCVSSGYVCMCLSAITCQGAMYAAGQLRKPGNKYCSLCVRAALCRFVCVCGCAMLCVCVRASLCLCEVFLCVRGIGSAFCMTASLPMYVSVSVPPPVSVCLTWRRLARLIHA